MDNLPFCYQDRDTTYTADRCNFLVKAAAENKIQLKALTRAGYPGDPLGEHDLPGVLSVGFWDAVRRQDWGLGTHRNEGIELTFLERGKLDFTADSKEHNLEPGDITITRPWQPHSLGGPNITPCRLHWIILDVQVRHPHNKWIWPDWLILSPEDRRNLTTLLSHNENLVWFANQEIKNCITQIAGLLKADDKNYRISRLTLLINQLFLSVLEMLSKHEISLEPQLSTTQRTVELFLESLRTNNQMLTRQWTSEMMADYCEVGLTQFNKLCKRITNMTPVQYLNCHRIEAAAQMLKNDPSLSITKTAFACGFNSSQYFATVFKKLKGRSPGEIRKDA